MAHIAQILAEGCLSPPRCCNKPSSFVFQCFAPRCFAEEERDLQSHKRARCSLHHRAEAPGDLVVTEPAPAGSSPVLGKLIFPLEALVPVGIPGSHNLPDHRKQITGLSAVKKQRGEEEEVLFPLLSSPIFARPLSGVPGIMSLPRCTRAVGKVGGSGRGGCVGFGDKLACDQPAAPQGSELQLGLHGRTKSARRERGGADLHQGTTFL